MARNTQRRPGSGGPGAPRRTKGPAHSGWRRAATFMVLPTSVVETMFARAAKWAIEEGGRFDPRPHAVLVWSQSSRQAPSKLVGTFSVRWRHPVRGFAVIHLIAWNEPNGGSLAEMCRAVELLAGVAWEEPDKLNYGR